MLAHANTRPFMCKYEDPHHVVCVKRYNRFDEAVRHLVLSHREPKETILSKNDFINRLKNREPYEMKLEVHPDLIGKQEKKDFVQL